MPTKGSKLRKKIKGGAKRASGLFGATGARKPTRRRRSRRGRGTRTPAAVRRELETLRQQTAMWTAMALARAGR